MDAKFVLGRARVVAAGLLACCVARSALACECGWVKAGDDGKFSLGAAPPLEAGEVADHDAVFLGRVVAVREVSLGNDAERRTIVTLEVERYWSGRVRTKMEVYGGLGIDCNYSFDEGERYVVFANRFAARERRHLKVPAGALQVHECSRTSRVENATDLTARLDRLRRSRMPTE